MSGRALPRSTWRNLVAAVEQNQTVHLTDTTQFADAFRQFIEERDPVADPDPARTAAVEALPDTPGEDDGTPASSLLESADLN